MLYSGMIAQFILGNRTKTAIMLVVLTGGFDRFTNASELCSYAGLTPMIRRSGSSVSGRHESVKWEIKS